LSQILRDFHLYAHGRVITLNSTPEHLVIFLDKYRLHGKMRFQLKEAAINRWKRTALASKVLRAVIPIRHASKESPVIVFGRFLNLVDQCQKVLIANGVKAHQLTGNMKPPTRRVILREFREKEYPVLVLSPLGTRGLDLPEVGLVVHLDITQSVDIIAQRSARIRGGQVWFVINADTSEEAKLRLVEDRLSPSKRYIAPSFPSIRKNKITEEDKLVDESQNLKEEHRELLDWFQHSKGEEL